MQRIAVYDLDKTITRGPTWTRFLVHAARARAGWRLALLPAAGIAALGHPLGLVDRAGLKAITQRLMIGPAIAPEAMAILAERFADRMLACNTLDAARARVAADRAAGHRLVLATASYGFYAETLGRRLGFDAVVATRARRDGAGRILPGVAGANCYGAAKLARVREWLAAEGLARAAVRVRAYSDHVSDAPLLEWADEAFAVNAHGPLARMAAARGWQSLDWR